MKNKKKYLKCMHRHKMVLQAISDDGGVMKSWDPTMFSCTGEMNKKKCKYCDSRYRYVQLKYTVTGTSDFNMG